MMEFFASLAFSLRLHLIPPSLCVCWSLFQLAPTSHLPLSLSLSLSLSAFFLCPLSLFGHLAEEGEALSARAKRTHFNIDSVHE